MRVRAGIVLIENNNVSLIERFRDGNHYYVFPGGGVDNGETPQEAAIREMEEETGLRVTIECELAEIHFELSYQKYYLAHRLDGEYGTGKGEEFTNVDQDNPDVGIYIPTWMPIEELSKRENIYPADIKDLVTESKISGWPDESLVIVDPKK